MKKVIPSFVFFAWCAVICAMEIVPIDPASACISIPSGRKNTVTVTCYGQNLVTFFIETCRGVFFRRQYDFVSGRLVRLVLPEDISSIRQISVDVEKRCLMIDGAQSLPPRQFTSDSDTVVTSDLDAIVETVSCPLLSIAAPNITMRGESFVPKLELRITGLSENRAAKIEGALSTEQMCVAGGKILNEGLIKFCNSNGNGNLNAETCEVENRGQICGDSDFVLRAHDVFNSGTIAGKQTEIRVDYLENTGEIGQENGLSKFNAYCIVNKGRLVAARGIFKISRSFFNDKELKIREAVFDGSFFFVNNGSVFMEKLDRGNANVFNRGKAPDFLKNVRAIPQKENPETKSAGLISECRDGYIINTKPGFWNFDTLSRERLEDVVNFYISAENRGDDVFFSLSRKGSPEFALNLSPKNFDQPLDIKKDFFHLYNRNRCFVCHIFDAKYDIYYDFSFDSKGNIELSSRSESSTGVEHGISYAFRTNGSVINRNPISFFSLIIDSKVLYNFDVLKTKNHLFRYRYGYNSGVLNLKEGASSNAKISAYANKTSLFGTIAKPEFKANREDNYGTVIGDNIAYFGNDAIIKLCGITLLTGVEFIGERNRIETQGALCHICGAMSGTVDYFVIQSGSVAVESFKLNSMKFFENDGVFLVREESEIRAGDIFLTGVISALHSVEVNCKQLLGGGTVFAGKSLTLSGRTSSSLSRDNVKMLSPMIIQNGQVSKTDDPSVGKFSRDTSDKFNIRRKGSEILERLEAEASEKNQEILKSYGSTNGIFIELLKSGFPPEKAGELLSLPYFYACLDADLRILHLCNEALRSASPEKATQEALQQVVLWKTNVEILETLFSKHFEVYAKLLREEAGERRKKGFVIGLGPEKFITLAKKIGTNLITDTATKDASEKKFYESVLEYTDDKLRKAARGGKGK